MRRVHMHHDVESQQKEDNKEYGGDDTVLGRFLIIEVPEHLVRRAHA